MDEQSRIILAIASRMLSYPSDDYRHDQSDIFAAIMEDLDSEVLRQKLNHAMMPLSQLPLSIIKEQYVETFDLKEKTGLYLTAHELGDSRKRGMELITLQTMIQNAGFVYRLDELADYIPLLYEFLAVTEDSEETALLQTRISLVTARIHKFLTEDSLYRAIFSILLDEVFKGIKLEELEKLEQSRENPDLDPMPYPLMYQ